MLKYLPALLLFLLLSCQEGQEQIVSEKPAFCDCRELHHHHTYNVFHQGDPKQPFTGLCKDFYRGGFLKKEAYFKDGKYHGDYKLYYKSGTLKSITAYEKGLVTGHQKLFDEKGNLVYHGIYKRNKLVENIFPKADSIQ